MDQSPRNHELPEADNPNDSTANNPGATRVAKPDESRAAPTTAEAGKNAISKTKTRRLVVCIDGTSNQFSDKNTNVVELYSHIKKDHNQLTYYNSGIGTYARPSWRSYTYMKQVFENMIDLAIAWNLEQVIIGAYRWLSDTYQPGDQIFLFGFSRGAYQVRALAGMIHNIGLLHPGNQEQIPFAWELYAKCDPERKEKYRDRIDAFKTAFSRDEVDLHFLGAWDTVSSVGIFRGRLLPLIKSCEHVTHFRHALALDERRVKFLPEYVTPAEDPDRQAKEVWFAGTHSDIGGGNQENLHMNYGAEPLIWMLKEARKAGLDLLPHNKKVGTYSEVTESLSGIWWLLELFPLSRVSHQPSGNITTSWKPHCGRGRKVLGHHKIHWSVLANYKRAIDAGPAYEPKSKLVLNDGIRREWKSIFEEQKGTHSALWEGDLDLIEALSLIKGMGSELQTTWLDEVLKYVTEPGKPNMIWTYGGPLFLRRLADLDKRTDVRVATIIRFVVGLKTDSKLLAKLSKYTTTTAQVIGEETDTLIIDGNTINDHIKTDVIPRVDDLLELWKTQEQNETSVEGGSRVRKFASGVGKKWKARTQSKVGANNHKRNNLLDQPPSRLAYVLKDIVLELQEYASVIYSNSNIFEKLPLLLPLNVTSATKRESILLARDITIAITELKNDDAHRGLYFGNVIQKLIPFLKEKNLNAELVQRVLRALKSLANYRAMASEIVEEGAVPLLIEFMTNKYQLLARDAIRVIGTLAKIGSARTILIQEGVPQKLIDLLHGDNPILIEAALGSIAAIAEYDSVCFSAKEQGIAEPISKLIKSSPNAVKAIGSFANNESIRAALVEKKVVAELIPLLQKSEPKVVQSTIRSIVELAKHDNSRAELAEHNVSPALAPLLDSATPEIIQAVLKALVEVVQYPELIKKDLLQRLLQLATDTGDPAATMAIVKAASFNNMRDLTPEKFIPSLIEWMESDEDELAASSRDVAVDFLVQESENGRNETIPAGTVQVLAKILQLACKRDAYYSKLEDPVDRMVQVTTKALHIVQGLSAHPEPRKALMDEGVFSSVAQLTNGPVSWTLDNIALRVVEKLEEYDDVHTEIRKHLQRRLSESATEAGFTIHLDDNEFAEGELRSVVSEGSVLPASP